MMLPHCQERQGALKQAKADGQTQRETKKTETSTTNSQKPARQKTRPKPAFSAKTKLLGETVRSRDLGLPPREIYAQLEAEYIKSLSTRKQEKALLTQHMFDRIWDVLHDPSSCKVGTPQFRWWVRKMFVLAYSQAPSVAAGGEIDCDLKPVVLHEDRPVVVRDQMYDVISYCHLLANHGGRDRTTAAVREHYSWVPKELIARFVKMCPTCAFKRTGVTELAFKIPGDTLNNVANVLNSSAAALPLSPVGSPFLRFVDINGLGFSGLVDTSLESTSWIEDEQFSPAFTSPIVSSPDPSTAFLPPLQSLLVAPSFPPLSPLLDFTPPTTYTHDLTRQEHHHSARWLTSLATQPAPNSSSFLVRSSASQHVEAGNGGGFHAFRGQGVGASGLGSPFPPSPFTATTPMCSPTFASPVPLYPEARQPPTFVQPGQDLDISSLTHANHQSDTHLSLEALPTDDSPPNMDASVIDPVLFTPEMTRNEERNDSGGPVSPHHT